MVVSEIEKNSIGTKIKGKKGSPQRVTYAGRIERTHPRCARLTDGWPGVMDSHGRRAGAGGGIGRNTH